MYGVTRTQQQRRDEHMADLKCPYCIEVRPSRSRLQTHIDNVHRDADTRENRRAAALSARTVENVVPDLPAQPTPPKCICGGELVQLETEPGEAPWWTHVWGAPDGSPCVDAAPVCDTVRKQDRANLAEHFADTGKRLAKAGEEIKELKAKADDVLARLEALDAANTKPEAVRRATLNQVWDKLIDAGNITGAQLVMRMIGQPGDWS